MPFMDLCVSFVVYIIIFIFKLIVHYVVVENFIVEVKFVRSSQLNLLFNANLEKTMNTFFGRFIARFNQFEIPKIPDNLRKFPLFLKELRTIFMGFSILSP